MGVGSGAWRDPKEQEMGEVGKDILYNSLVVRTAGSGQEEAL